MILAYLIVTGYIGLVMLVPVLVLLVFVKDQRLWSLLKFSAFLCLGITLAIRGTGWLSDKNQRNQVERHLLAFAKFCADSPVSPIIRRTAPVNGAAVVELRNTAKQELPGYRNSGQLADSLKGSLICKTRRSLGVMDASVGKGQDLCSDGTSRTDGPLPAANYQLTFEKVAEQTFPENSTSNGAMRMTKVGVQIRDNNGVLGEDVIYVAQQAPGAYYDRCPYPKQRLAELLTGVFQLLEVKEGS